MTKHIAYVTFAAAAGLGGPALAAEPLAEVMGLEEGTVRETVVSAIGAEDAAPESVFEARRRAERARDRAQAALRSEGFYAARVEIEIVRGAAPRARLQIDPGARFVIGNIGFELGPEATEASRRAAREAVKLSEGAPARAADVIQAEANAVAAVLAAGFPEAQAGDRRVVVDHATGEMDVTLRIRSGRPAVLGPIVRQGSANLREGFVRELAPYEPGDDYAREPLDTLAGRLRSTGAFASVNVRLEPSDPSGAGVEERDVIVEVEQGDRHSIGVGATYSTSEGGGVEATWERRNMFGGGETLSLAAALRTIDRRLDAELKLPHWRRPNRTLRLNTAAIDEETDAYNRRALEAGATAETRLSERLSGAVGAGVSFERIEDDQGTNNFGLLNVSGAITWDGSNDVLDPTRGLRATGLARPTFGVSDEAVGYVVADGTASAYQTLGSDRWVAAVQARVGALLGPPLADVPADERFFAGGGGSVRGYDYQSISPRNEEGELTGGRSIGEVSAELRFRPDEESRWGYAAFIDGGAAWRSVEPDWDDVRWGAGVGVRYYTSFGPIRFDIAAPLDRRDGDSPVHFYVSIGQAF